MNPNNVTLLQSWDVAKTTRLWIGGNNLDVRREIEAIAASYKAPPNVPIDCAFITPIDADEAAYFAEKLSSRLVQNAPVWVAWAISDGVGLAAVSACLRNVGFDEFRSVAFSANLVTVGFRRRC